MVSCVCFIHCSEKMTLHFARSRFRAELFFWLRLTKEMKPRLKFAPDNPSELGSGEMIFY